jgi:thioredoxin 1
MTKEEFEQKLRAHSRPVVVDFWAVWCAPCRAIEPALKQLEKEYAGRVDTWKINADEEMELLRSLHIYGIPTLIAYRDDKDVARRTGAAPMAALASLYESALSGEPPKKMALAFADRLLRLGAGLAVISIAVLSGLSGMHWLVAAVGAGIMFTAVYDRCPIWQALTAQFKRTGV